MNRKIIAVLAILVLALGLAYANRGQLRDAWAGLMAPELPPEQPFVPTSTLPENPATTSAPVAKPAPPAPKPPTNDQFPAEPMPREINLAVPFTTQAPHANWSMPYQEACEEASAMMVDAYYKKQTGKIAPDVADAEIKKIVAFEESLFGYYEDTTAEETARLIREYYGYSSVVVKPIESADDIKKVLADGYPVIIPAAGKLLGNPNFRNGGPDYHMLVIRGYTPTLFITNDPGTRNGQGYTYSYETILNAVHDWTGSKSTVKTGKRVMIVVMP